MEAGAFLLNKIRYNVLFESVDDALMEATAKSLSELQYGSGETIFKDGTEGDCLYLLVSGNVRISKATSSGEEIVIGTLNANDCFGELDLIDERLRSATAIAASTCTAIRLPVAEFRKLLDLSPAFSSNLLRMLALRVRGGNSTYVGREESNLSEVLLQFDKVHD